jgi:serine/threonine protein kinase
MLNLTKSETSVISHDIKFDLNEKDFEKIVAERVKSTLVSRLRERIEDRDRFKSSQIGINIDSTLGMHFRLSSKSPPIQRESFKSKDDSQNQVTDDAKAPLNSNMKFSDLVWKPDFFKMSRKKSEGNYVSIIKDNFIGIRIKPLVSQDFSQIYQETSLKTGKISTSKYPYNLNKDITNNRASYIKILERTNNSEIELNDGTLATKMRPQTSKHKKFSKEPDAINFDGPIDMPKIVVSPTLKKLKSSSALKIVLNKRLSKKPEENQNQQNPNVKTKSTLLKTMITEKELGTMNIYYYYLRKPLNTNPNFGGLLNHIKRVFNESADDQAAQPVFETKIIFYEIHQRMEKTSIKRIMRGKQIITNSSVLMKVVTLDQVNAKFIEELHFQIYLSRKCFGNPYVLKSFETVKEADELYLISEYVDSIDLLTFIRKGKNFLDKNLPIFFYEILYGVKMIHDEGFIHGNISTKSILVGKHFDPKLMNFSLKYNNLNHAFIDLQNKYHQRSRKAKFFQTNTTFKKSTLSMSHYRQSSGKVIQVNGSYKLNEHALTEQKKFYQYTAPEVNITNRNYCTPKIDVWSLGILLFYLAYKKLPFKGDNVKAIKEQILMEQIDFPEKLDEQSLNLNELIKDMLKPSFKERISMEEAMKHRWFGDIKKKFKPLPSKANAPSKNKIKNGLLMFLEDIGFPAHFILEKFNEERPNHINSCFSAMLNSS